MTKKTWTRAGVLLLLFAVAVVFAPRISCKHRQTSNNPVGYFERGPYMHEARYDHTATLLDDGNVLIAGGANPGKTHFSKTAELYLSKKNKFKLIRGLNIPRVHYASVKLKNGKVLFFGGGKDGQPQETDTVEEYDPATQQFTIVGKMLDRRWQCQAVLLDNGIVLIYGGATGHFPGKWKAEWCCELYDPVTNTSRLTSSMHYVDSQIGPTLVMLAGRVFIKVGISYTPEEIAERVAKKILPSENDPKPDRLGAIEIYDPKTDTFELQYTLQEFHREGSLALLPDGRVLIMGGYPQDNFVGKGCSNTFEIYDPKTSKSEIAGHFRYGVRNNDFAFINNKFILLQETIGGAQDEYVRLMEAIDINSMNVISVGTMNITRFAYTMTTLPGGNVLLAGGYQIKTGNKITMSEIFIVNPINQ